MFDPDLYRKTCSESLRLSEETLEEMIVMTENKKRTVRKPLQIALTAAALAVVMCVTAAAANPEEVKNLWETFTMGVSVVLYNGDGDTVTVKTALPEVSVDEVDGRTVLNIAGETTDITDTLAQDGEYVGEWKFDDTTAGTITVHADLTWELETTMSDGTKAGVDYFGEDGFSDAEKADLDIQEGAFTFTDDENVPNATYLPPEE